MEIASRSLTFKGFASLSKEKKAGNIARGRLAFLLAFNFWTNSHTGSNEHSRMILVDGGSNEVIFKDSII